MLEQIRQSAESWGIKVLFAIIIVVFVFYFGFGTANTPKTETVLATVNGDAIGIQDYEEAYKRELESLRQQNPDLTEEDIREAGIKAQLFNELVDRTLMRQQARAMNISATTVERQAYILGMSAFQDESGQFSRERYELALRSVGMSDVQFERAIGQDIVIAKLSEYITMPAFISEAEARDNFDSAKESRTLEFITFNSVDHVNGTEPAEEKISEYYEANKDQFAVPATATVEYLSLTPAALAEKATVTDGDIEAYYNTHTSKFATPERVKARHILIRTEEDADDAAVAEALQKAQAAYERVTTGGEDFATVAMEVSEGPTGPKGGELPWFSRGEMVPEFEEAAFNAEPGTVAEPVKTMFGWHVILVEKHEEPGVMPLDEVKDAIRETLAEEKGAGVLAGILDDALDLAYSGVDLADIAQQMDLAVKTSEPMTQDEAVSTLSITPADAERLFTLDPGRTAEDAFQLSDGYLLVKVKDFTEATHQPLDAVKADIGAILVRQQTMDMAKQDAENALAAIKEQDSALGAYELQTSSPFDRFGLIPELGFAPELAAAAYLLDSGEWLENPYEIGSGYIIARVKDRIPPSEEEWEAGKENVMSTLLQNRKNMLLTAFVQDQRASAKIEILVPELLE